MTREQFVRNYAASSNVSDKLAPIGIIDVGDGWTLVALPCACGEDGCQGWAMVSAEQVTQHLAFQAPENLRKAYRDCIGDLVA